MRINNKKTVVMHCGKTPLKINLTIGSHRLEQVKEFKYVGTIIDGRGQIDTELASRMSLASRIFGSLCRRVFRNSDIEIRDQMRIYDAKVLSVLLYNAEVWTLREKQMQKLEAFHMKHIRYICGKTRLDRMRNTALLKMAGTESIRAKIFRKRMNWVYILGHQPFERLPRGVMYLSASEKRARGAPPLHWSKQASETLDLLQLSPWLQERKGKWRQQVRIRVEKWHKQLIENQTRKADEKKEAQQNPTSLPEVCDQCPARFPTKRGLQVHKGMVHRSAPKSSPPRLPDKPQIKRHLGPLSEKCDKCDATFATKRGVQVHKGRKHKEPPS